MVPLFLHNVDLTIASFQFPVVLDENPFLVIANEGISDTIEMDFNHNHSPNNSRGRVGIHDLLGLSHSVAAYYYRYLGTWNWM
ncbi:MAG: hypothetical protein CM1200mP10_14720 [Candidatus Neomarinimicrobiota bacterium]|nr:MAG: hypothetical protein CM1200mP10_14720 [Candidatus Neomarinimicrobiota bacterium]